MYNGSRFYHVEKFYVPILGYWPRGDLGRLLYTTYFDENVLVNAVLVRLVALSIVDARVNDDNCTRAKGTAQSHMKND